MMACEVGSYLRTIWSGLYATKGR